MMSNLRNDLNNIKSQIIKLVNLGVHFNRLLDWEKKLALW